VAYLIQKRSAKTADITEIRKRTSIRLFGFAGICHSDYFCLPVVSYRVFFIGDGLVTGILKNAQSVVAAT
jgi:hypothetical protein